MLFGEVNGAAPELELLPEIPLQYKYGACALTWAFLEDFLSSLIFLPQINPPKRMDPRMKSIQK